METKRSFLSNNRKCYERKQPTKEVKNSKEIEFVKSRNGKIFIFKYAKFYVSQRLGSLQPTSFSLSQ